MTGWTKIRDGHRRSLADGGVATLKKQARKVNSLNGTSIKTLYWVRINGNIREISDTRAEALRVADIIAQRHGGWLA